MNNKAIVTGASGQDAILLSNLLLSKGWEVFAMQRRSARPESRYVLNLLNNKNYHLIQGDITDMSSLIHAINLVKPDHFYNLAAQSHVGISFEEPISTANITGLGVLNCLEAIRKTKPDTRFYQASSSEMFGGTKTEADASKFISGPDIEKYKLSIIDENTPFEPRSPYACAKVFGHSITKNYREAYNMHASCGILFNHESEVRKKSFVTRKVTAYVAELSYAAKHSSFPKLKLGCLDFARDWGCAKDYVNAMYSMLMAEKPDDYVIATGKVFTGEQLLETAFSHIEADWKKHIEIDKQFARPTDVKVLVGNANKAKEKLGWEPTRNFKQLIIDMVENDKHIFLRNGIINE